MNTEKLTQIAIRQEIRLAMARAGLDSARDLALAIDPEATPSQINLLQRKLKGSRTIIQPDVEKVCEATGHVQTLSPSPRSGSLAP